MKLRFLTLAVMLFVANLLLASCQREKDPGFVIEITLTEKESADKQCFELTEKSVKTKQMLAKQNWCVGEEKVISSLNCPKGDSTYVGRRGREELKIYEFVAIMENITVGIEENLMPSNGKYVKEYTSFVLHTCEQNQKLLEEKVLEFKEDINQ